MDRRMSTVVSGLSVVVIGALMAAGVSHAQDGGSPGPFNPVATVVGLMNGQGMAFKRLQQAVTDRRMQERHKTIQMMAEVLAELSNVNQYNEKKADYQGWAREARDLALMLSEEAKKEAGADDNFMRKSLRDIKAKCTACHDVYQ